MWDKGYSLATRYSLLATLMIGIGFDIHRLVKGRPLRLGGVRIPYPKGLLGHSDADVLLHALVDAILGAAGLGDIGEYFPDTDPRFKDCPSGYFVRETLKLIRRRRLKVRQIDTIIFAESPKLTSYKGRLRRSLARLVGLAPARVNIKAKTMEGLGPIGSKRAIAALVLIQLIRIS